MTAPPAGAPHPGGQQTLDSASAALSGADPQSLYQSGQRFTATAEQLRTVTDEFRARLREVESAWSGSGAQAFAEVMSGVTHRLDGLVSSLSSPDCGWLCRELGDALATAQRELQQLRDERASQPGGAAPPQAGVAVPPRGSAAPPAGQQQLSPQDGRAHQVMNELANTYRQLGGQLHVLPGKRPETPPPRQVALSEAGSAQGDERSAPDAGRGAADAIGTGPLPAGGVLGKHPPTHRAPESTVDCSAPARALGRPEPTSTHPTAFALTAGTLGRAHHEPRHHCPPAGQTAEAETGQPGVLGNPARGVSTQPEHVKHGQAQHRQALRDLVADPTSEQQDAAQSAGPPEAVESTPPPAAVPPPPAMASSPPPEQAPPPGQNAAPLPDRTAASAPAEQQAAAQAPLHELAAATPPQPVPGPDPTVSTTNADAPTPPHPARPDAAPAQPGPLPPEHPNGPGAAIPPEHGAGATVSNGDERNRNTWMPEHTTTWQPDDHSGVLGR